MGLGMYIEGFCGSWMEHPFWRSKFVITDAHELRLLHECAIKEVLIDVSQGLDVVPAAATNADPATVAAEPQPPVVSTEVLASSDTEAVSMRDEYQRAAAICKAATGAVRHMFAEVRMGRAIDQEVARQVAEEITDSVLRNGGALISLARLKSADGYTYMHSVAVCALMVALARKLGLSAAETRAAGFAGLMHDLGKADVPLEVLNKAGRLTEAEFAQVRLHPEHGHRRLLAAGVDDPMALDVCLHHHERLDGKGYPKRLAGEAISRMARMGAVCDVYDAITSNRPYKEGWDPAESLAKMAQWTHGRLDAAIFQAF
ncbi:MAG: phosphodiesterase, partial [Burkholderiales bacterium 12-64-5]